MYKFTKYLSIFEHSSKIHQAKFGANTEIIVSSCLSLNHGKAKTQKTNEAMVHVSCVGPLC
jgi:hypothetical protein